MSAEPDWGQDGQQSEGDPQGYQEPQEVTDEETIEETAEEEETDDWTPPAEVSVEYQELPRSEAFNWYQVGQVTQFALDYLRTPLQDRTLFQNLVGSWGDPVQVARALYPPTVQVFALRFIVDVARARNGGLQDGMRLSMAFAQYELDTVRAVVTMTNAIGEHFDPAFEPLKYRRNMATLQVLQFVMESLGALHDDQIAILEGFSGLLEVWPGAL